MIDKTNEKINQPRRCRPDQLQLHDSFGDVPSFAVTPRADLSDLVIYSCGDVFDENAGHLSVAQKRFQC